MTDHAKCKTPNCEKIIPPDREYCELCDLQRYVHEQAHVIDGLRATIDGLEQQNSALWYRIEASR